MNTEIARVGEFINIPSWNTFGMVVSVEVTPSCVEDDERAYDVQEYPTSERTKRYLLRPFHFEII